MESVFYGRYQLIDKIATGGMAEVYKAKYETFGGIEKQVIVKRILPQYSGDPEFVRMFMDEAKISVALQHVNLVQVFDFGQIDGNHYLAMEYVEGADLQSVLRECHFRRIPIPMELSVLLVAEVLRGLDYAHRRLDPSTGKKMNIVHRDISPANILISYSGNVKVADFGIAKARTKSSHTQVGTLKGKYSYMSPEQARGEEVDFRSDIFSCGIILYELVTGVRPFRSKVNNELEILEKVKSARYEPSRNVNPHIPARLAEIIDKALARDREQRFAETAIFCDRLSAVLGEFETRPDSSSLAKFLRKVFAEEGKKSRTDLSALVERAIDAKPDSQPDSKVEVDAGEPVALDAVSASGRVEFAVAALRYRKPEGEDSEQRLLEFLAGAEDEVANRGGRVEQRTAEGLIAYFGADPHAVDQRLRAVETARKVVDLGRRAGRELALTAGVCAGSAEGKMTQAAVKAVAQAMRRAEKLAEQGDAAGVLVDEEVAQHVGEGFVLRRVGESGGTPVYAPIRAAKAERPSGRSRSGLQRTVGRDMEQRRLVSRLDEVLAGQGARVVALTGSPGLGKSHLAHELVRAAAGKGAGVVLGKCLAAGRQVTFSVFHDLIRDLLGLPDGAGREATSQRMERVVSELNLAPSLPATLKPLFGGARAVSAGETASMGNALKELLGAMTFNNKAMVLVIEDLHWADEPSRLVIGGLAELLRRERVLLLVTARPDVERQWLGGKGRNIDEIRLSPLDDASILRIAADRLQLSELSPELSSHLRGKARGNPYYLLESIRNLTEKGLMGGAATNRQDLTDSVAYSPVIAQPRVLSEKGQQALDRARAAVSPQVQGFADDVKRAGKAIKPVAQQAVQGIANAFKMLKKVKKDFDPKTVDSLGKDDGDPSKGR